MASSRPRTRFSTTRSTSLSTAAFSYTTAVYASAGMATSDVGSPAVTVTTRGPPSSAAISPNISPDPRSALRVPLIEEFRPGAEGDPGCRRRQPAPLLGAQSLEHGDFADDLFHHHPPGFRVGLGRGVSGRGSTREAGNLLWHARSAVSCLPGR